VTWSKAKQQDPREGASPEIPIGSCHVNTQKAVEHKFGGTWLMQASANNCSTARGGGGANSPHPCPQREGGGGSQQRGAGTTTRAIEKQNPGQQVSVCDANDSLRAFTDCL
jgi:hypothetical protein